MKKYMFTFSAIIIAMMSFVSCSKDLNYRKACEDREWAKAYEIVDELKKELMSCREDLGGSAFDIDPYKARKKREEQCSNAEKNYKEAFKYVVLQEALFVLEESGERGLMRIAGIIKEHNADWLYSELFGVMASIGNDEMKEKILKMAEGGGAIHERDGKRLWPTSKYIDEDGSVPAWAYTEVPSPNE